MGGGSNGAHAVTPLLHAAGILYGTDYGPQDGSSANGTVFKVVIASKALTTLHRFLGLSFTRPEPVNGSSYPNAATARTPATSTPAATPASTSSAITATAPPCRSAHPTGPGFTTSNSRNSPKAAATPSQDGRGSASSASICPAISSITTQPGSSSAPAAPQYRSPVARAVATTPPPAVTTAATASSSGETASNGTPMASPTSEPAVPGATGDNPLPNPLAIHQAGDLHAGDRKGGRKAGRKGGRKGGPWVDIVAIYQDSPRMSHTAQTGNLLAQADALARAGRLAESAAALVQAARLAPTNTDILLRLAVAQRRAGQLDPCIETYRRLLRQKPNFAEAHYNLGNAFLQAGRFADAARAYARALALRPGYTEAQNNLGHAHLALGDAEQALTHFTAIAAATPAQPEAHANVGAACFTLGRFAEAAAAYARATALRPTDPELWRKRQGAEQARGATPDSLVCARAIAALSPNDPAALHDLAKHLVKQSPADAVAMFRAALALAPDSLESALLLSATLLKLDRTAEALAVLDAFPSTPETAPSILANRGTVLRNLMRLEEAEAALRRAIALAPDHAAAHASLGINCLLAGRDTEGFALYERRHDLTPPRADPAPRWQGQPLAGRTLLVHAEGGFGDTLQFCRFLPQAAQGGRVVVTAQAALLGLLRDMPGVAAVFPENADPPPHDFQLPMMSLPFALGIRIASLPAGPYLRADPDRAATWQARLAACPGLRVGLCWRGNADYTQDVARSVPAKTAARLLDIPGICFVSLQKDAADPLPSPNLLDWTAELADFSDTAALVAALDLVISADTSVVHLAGALGAEVWLLNRFNTEWRWLTDRTDSPWYHRMRIFRQPAAGDWESVVVQVSDALDKRKQGLLF